MAQALGDSASVEAGRSFDDTMYPVKTVVNNAVSNALVKTLKAITFPVRAVGKASLYGLGLLLGFCGKKLVEAFGAKKKANQEYARENGWGSTKEKSDPKRDAIANASREHGDAEPKISEFKADKSVPEHYNEVFTFDNPEMADKIFALSSLADKDVKISGKHLACKKEDAAAIYAMAKYSGVACCSLTDMMALHAYAKKAKEEQQKLYPDTEVGVNVTIDPAHFEMLEDQRPENVVNFLHEAGVSSAKLRDDGKIIADSEELETLDAALKVESVTMGDMKEAAEKVEKLQLENVVERMGKHFKGQEEKQKDSHDHDKDNHDKDDHDDRDRSR